MKLAMMVPPPPTLPPLAPPMPNAAPAQFSLLDTLLPNFNTDTFIWRVSLLQITASRPLQHLKAEISHRKVP